MIAFSAAHSEITHTPGWDVSVSELLPVIIAVATLRKIIIIIVRYGIHYLCPLIQVFDMNTALKFYCEVLGFHIHESASWSWRRRSGGNDT
ncbi:VOC family protein [Parapedobacter sp. DT-150]|uniref:VOC family protein n=1 Tax=Parapedobacter sp. DT-150 TaxID=3396162 RepID=UPI003F1DFE27